MKIELSEATVRQFARSSVESQELEEACKAALQIQGLKLPWEIIPSGRGEYRVLGGKVEGRRQVLTTFMSQNQAKLIAAAPELAQVLKRILTEGMGDELRIATTQALQKSGWTG